MVVTGDTLVSHRRGRGGPKGVSMVRMAKYRWGPRPRKNGRDRAQPGKGPWDYHRLTGLLSSRTGKSQAAVPGLAEPRGGLHPCHPFRDPWGFGVG